VKHCSTALMCGLHSFLGPSCPRSLQVTPHACMFGHTACMRAHHLGPGCRLIWLADTPWSPDELLGSIPSRCPCIASDARIAACEPHSKMAAGA
jgi:hypothetical protein